MRIYTVRSVVVVSCCCCPLGWLACHMPQIRQRSQTPRDDDPRAKRPPPLRRKLAQMLLPLLVPLTYLVTISPYLYNSKKIYGHAFNN